ncbi:MAG: hypothetical protein QXW97_01260 [Candidatus Pacearchaeota archaeon]
MGTLIKNVFLIISIIIFFLLNLSIFIATPPKLPTMIYGKVLKENNEPYPGAKVTIIWTNYDGELKSITQNTLTNEKAGYYKFKDIDAEENTPIKIQSYGITITLNAIPGAQIKAPDIIIPNSKKSFFQNLFSKIKNVFESKENELNEELKNNNNEYEKKQNEISLKNNLDNKNLDNESKKINENNSIDVNSVDIAEPNYEDYYKYNEKEENYINEEENIIILNDSEKKSKNEIFKNKEKTNYSPIIEIPEIIYLCENSSLSQKFKVIDMNNDDIEIYLNPNYPNSPFFIRKIFSNKENEKLFEIYSDVITKESLLNKNFGVKNYNLKVSASDGYLSDEKEINIILIEKNNPPKIENIGVQTFELNKTFYKEIHVTDEEDGNNNENFKFIISNDDSNSLEISSNGILSLYNENPEQGIYRITICVLDNGLKFPFEKINYCNQDGKSLKICQEFLLTVTAKNHEPWINYAFPSEKILIKNQGEILSLSISTTDLDGTVPDVYWFLNNNLISYEKNKFTSELKYEIPCNISKIHNIKAEITDGIANDSVIWTIDIKTNPNCIETYNYSCNENWGCSQWKECRSISEINDYKLLEEIREKCNKNGWSNQICGYQKRECIDLNNCKTNKSVPKIFQECYFTKDPNCNDKIKNCHDDSCEILTDCGGPCKPCPTCNDKIQNQNEKGIDCEGECYVTCKKQENLYSINTKLLENIAFIFLTAFLIISILIVVSLTIRVIILKKTVSKLNQTSSYIIK